MVWNGLDQPLPTREREIFKWAMGKIGHYLYYMNIYNKKNTIQILKRKRLLQAEALFWLYL